MYISLVFIKTMVYGIHILMYKNERNKYKLHILACSKYINNI